MQRVVVIGTAGSGKSHLSERLAPLIGAPLIELDALFWLPGWKHQPFDEFWHLVNNATVAPRWIVAGNYTIVRDITWRRADTMIWLDYPIGLVMQRLFRRTLSRIVSGEELWGTGNRETWRNSFADRESILLYALKSWKRNRDSFERALSLPVHEHLTVHRFRDPRETQAWLSSQAATGATSPAGTGMRAGSST